MQGGGERRLSLLTSSTKAPSSLWALTALTRLVAAEVRAGRHDVPIDPDRRWYRQLRDDGDVDGIRSPR